MLSEELLARVWGVVADLRRDPRTGTPYLLPHHLVAPPATGPSALLGRGPVHVIGGGGSAAPYLRALAEAGYRVTAGALHLLDTDLETAESLGALTAVEVPFAPIGEEARQRLRTLLDGSDRQSWWRRSRSGPRTCPTSKRSAASSDGFLCFSFGDRPGRSGISPVDGLALSKRSSVARGPGSRRGERDARRARRRASRPLRLGRSASRPSLPR